MSLLRDIQSAATASDKPVSEVLRMCAVLAKRLGHEPLAQWVKLELDGYPDVELVPDYRTHPVQVLSQQVGPMAHEIGNVPVPQSAVPEEFRENIFNVRLGEGAAKLESFADTDQKSLSMPVNQDFVLAYLGHGKILQRYTTMTAWRAMPVAVLNGVLDTVRNRILTFALEIEDENPDAGEAPVGEEPVPSPIVAQHFNTTILGGTNNLAIAGRDAAQTITNVTAGNWDSLQEALRVLGIPESDIAELRDALEKDEGSQGIGEYTQGWIGKIMSKVKTGAFALASGMTVELVVDIIMMYLGLG